MTKNRIFFTVSNKGISIDRSQFSQENWEILQKIFAKEFSEIQKNCAIGENGSEFFIFPITISETDAISIIEKLQKFLESINS